MKRNINYNFDNNHHCIVVVLTFAIGVTHVEMNVSEKKETTKRHEKYTIH